MKLGPIMGVLRLNVNHSSLNVIADKVDVWSLICAFSLTYFQETKKRLFAFLKAMCTCGAGVSSGWIVLFTGATPGRSRILKTSKQLTKKPTVSSTLGHILL